MALIPAGFRGITVGQLHDEGELSDVRIIIMGPVTMLAPKRMSADCYNEICVTSAQHKPHHQLLCDDVADPFSRFYNLGRKKQSCIWQGACPLACAFQLRKIFAPLLVRRRSSRRLLFFACFAGLVASHQKFISKFMPTQLIRVLCSCVRKLRGLALRGSIN